MHGGSVHVYGRMMESMDANIGRVMRELARLGIDQDTIVIFTSDNGGERFSDSWPLTGMKGELLEGGIRVPLIVSWPRQLPKGKESAQVAMSMDALPTLVDAAGGQVPYGIDGENLMPNLRDPETTLERQVFWRHKARRQFAARIGDWKYLRIEDREFLFNLSADVRERANLKDVEIARFSRMKASCESWNAGMLAYPDGSYSEDIKGKFADRI